MQYVRAISLVVLVSLMAACSGPQPLPEAPTPIPTLIPATLPAAIPAGDQGAASVTKPLSAEYTIGQQIFDSSCKACHKLTDEKLVGPGLGGLFERKAELPGARPFSVENLIDWIKKGGGAMPGFGQLTEDELAGVVEFLKEETGPEVALEPPAGSGPAGTATQQPGDASGPVITEPNSVSTPGS